MNDLAVCMARSIAHWDEQRRELNQASERAMRRRNSAMCWITLCIIWAVSLLVR